MITGASSGIGYELAIFCAKDGFDLVVVADEPEIEQGTVYLIQKVGKDMRARGHGRILITGSIAGYTPGTYNAVYNASKAFIDSFSFALRAELKDSGVTVTCLMPGATETEFFERAGMEDTEIGQSKKEDTEIGQSKKDDPVDVAKVGFEAMMKGEGDVVSGFKNKVMSTVASVT
ncbi:MAG TPA: SDR family NAD(P)-dependent oxidoreductase, partial [Pyrinomonadaceae bacterium]